MGHPDALVETTSLAAMSSPRPNFPIRESLGQVCGHGKLSAPQLETCLLACQRHQSILPDGKRAGFLLGDGAGVGKGRQLAGIILDSWLRGRRRHIWVSVSADLQADAQRDLEEIGAGSSIRVKSLSDMSYDEIGGEANHFKSGVLFVTYRCLIGETKSPDKSRLQQIEEWWCSAGRDAKGPGTYDGCLLFDEAHRAKNLANNPPSKTALAVERLSSRLAGARVVYASATGASEARHMAYMTRLGLWGEGCGFRTFAEFRRFVEKRGTACMELLASDLKGRGAYLARTLSYAAATFETIEVPLSAEASAAADAAADYWRLLLDSMEHVMSLAELAAKERQSLTNLYWASHQRFFIQLVLGMKVPSVVKLAKQSLEAGKCVVIGMQSTGEAGLSVWLETHAASGVSSSLPSLARSIVDDLLLKLKDLIDRAIIDGESDSSAQAAVVLSQRTSGLVFSGSESDEEPDPDGEDGDDLPISTQPPGVYESAELRKKRAIAIHADLVKRANTLVLPTNAIDELIDCLGGVEHVAELSGRTGRMESTAGASADAKRYFRFRKRNFKELDDRVNIAERNCFQNGEKLVAVLTDACSTGISLQANRKAKNQRQRVHITIQLPWAAESVIQQFGRTHRSNQSSAPEYKMVVLKVPGEKRMSAGIAKKMEALGALTKGDAKAGAAGAAFGANLHHLGKEALNFMAELASAGEKSASELAALHMLPDCCINSTNRDAALDSFESDLSCALRKMRLLVPGKIEVNRFLNRISGLRLQEQELAFGYFEKVHAALQRAEVMSGKKKSTVDLAGKCVLVSREHVKLYGSSACATHVVVERDRGVSWEAVMKKFAEAKDSTMVKPGIWRARKEWHGTKRLIYTEQLPSSSQLDVYRPGTGKLTGGMSWSDASEKYVELSGSYSSSSIKRLWEEQYKAAVEVCSHGESCKNWQTCTHGKRVQEVSILSGNISEAWSRIEKMVPHAKLNKVVRAECTDNTRVVGLQMPADTVEQIMQALSQRLPANESRSKMELALRDLQLNTDAAAMVVRLCDCLQSSAAAGIVLKICEQLTPAIVTAINSHSLPDQLEQLITYLEGAFCALREARTEKRMMKAELAQLLIQSVAETETERRPEGSENGPGNPEPVAKVRAKILTKLQEATRQHSERQQRREAEKQRAQAGSDDDDDDFAEVKKSPINPKGAAASSSTSSKKSQKLKTDSRAKPSASSAAQMRLNRAAADKTQQRLGFGSLSAINRDMAVGTSKQPQADKETQRHRHRERNIAATETGGQRVPSREFSGPAASPCNAASMSAPALPSSGAMDMGMSEEDENQKRDGSFSAGKRRSRMDDGEKLLDNVDQRQLKRLRVSLRSGQYPCLKFKNLHMELRVGQNLLSLGTPDESVRIAGGTPQLPKSAEACLAVYVSARREAVLMSSTAVGPKISVLSEGKREPEFLHPHVPIILADGDTIELR